MIEQEQRAKVPAKKMKQYSSGKSTAGKSLEIPKKDFALKNQADGSMDYIQVEDKMAGADASKINKGHYKLNRYK